MNTGTRAAAFALLALPGTAQAAKPAANEYGQHVRHCAQTMGFSGEHNPGTHHGNSGWDAMTCQH
jgi:hypothetical protein